MGVRRLPVLSLILERGLVRFLYRRPLDSMLATYGVSIIIVQLVRVIFGPAPQTVYTPIPGGIDIAGLPLAKYRLFVLGVRCRARSACC